MLSEIVGGCSARAVRRNMAEKTRRSGNKRRVSQVNQRMITSSAMGREVGAEPRGVFQLGGRDEKQHCGGAPAREGETVC